MTMKTRVAIWVEAAVLFVYLLTACGEINHKDALNGSAWTLTSFDSTPPLKGTKLTVEFAEGQIGGSSGCNSYGGTYEIKGKKITTGSIAMTMMACADPGVMEQEQTFLEYLQDAQTYKLSKGQLTTRNKTGDLHPHALGKGSGQADYLCNAYSMLRDPHDDKQWKSADV